MKRFLSSLLLSLCLLAPGAFAAGSHSSSSHSSSGKTVHVRSYTKKDGTHVKAYKRRPPKESK